MSSFFTENKTAQNPLMDFVQEAYGLPETITQAGINSNKDKLWLSFDGEKLRLMKGENSELEWNAVSGKQEYQSPEFQYLKNTGPLPEGNYNVRQDKYSKMGIFSDFIGTNYPKIRRNAPSFIKAYMPVKVGSWNGGSNAWGTQKINLIPNGEQEMYGRDNFFIHGGKYPSSAGCIDLTRDNDNFMQTFLALGKDLPLEVIYEKK